jgi:predicted Zn-dependent protease
VDTATERLTSAKTAMVTRDRGNQIPYDVISSTLEGWGRFTMVDTAAKADLVVTVATTGGDSPVKTSASAKVNPLTGRPESSSGGGVEYSNAEITMTVYDAKTKRVLWTAVQTAKSAMKQTARENNLVEAAEKLASKFHDRLEPPPRDKDQD